MTLLAFSDSAWIAFFAAMPPTLAAGAGLIATIIAGLKARSAANRATELVRSIQQMVRSTSDSQMRVTASMARRIANLTHDEGDLATAVLLAEMLEERIKARTGLKPPEPPDTAAGRPPTP